MFPKKIDVTAITGHKINGPVTSWRTASNGKTVNHLAGPSPDGDLLVFWWSPGSNWQVVNVSRITGAKISGPATSWTVPAGNKIVEHVAAPSPDGDLLVFWWSSGSDWQVVNVSQKTGATIGGPVTGWTVPSGDTIIEHLAAPSSNGDLLVFWRETDRDWKLVNVSHRTGATISGPVTRWTVPSGNTIIEHLAAPSTDGDLLVFSRISGGDWQVVNVSQTTGKTISGPVSSWTAPSGDTLVEHLAGRSPDGDLLVFWWSSGGDWQVVNVTQITGDSVSGTPQPYQLHRNGGNDEILVVKGLNGSMHLMWWRHTLDWQSLDLKEALQIDLVTQPAVWTVPNGPALVEHIAAADPNGHLIVAWFDSEMRRLTDALSNSFPHLSRQQSKKRHRVVIFWAAHRPDPPTPSQSALADPFMRNASGNAHMETGWQHTH